MHDTSSIIARQKKQRVKQSQEGTIVSFTTVRHPPAGFPSHARQIGLIELDDGSHVMGTLIGNTPVQIGQRVVPRMQKIRTNKENLHTYSICYEPTADVRETNVEQEFPGYILALTGPSGVGKSTVSNLLTKAFAEYTMQVPILTTRKASSQDNGEYKHITQKQFAELQKKGKLAAFTKIPSKDNNRWYGYRTSDIEAIWKKGKVPVVITEMHLLQGLAETYSRRSILSCGLLPPGSSKRAMLSQLLHRLRTRGRDSEQSIKDRLENAKKDLQFFFERTDLFDHMLVNKDLEKVVKTLKRHILALSKA